MLCVKVRNGSKTKPNLRLVVLGGGIEEVKGGQEPASGGNWNKGSNINCSRKVVLNFSKKGVSTFSIKLSSRESDLQAREIRPM